jgi:hypothetical protein
MIQHNKLAMAAGNAWQCRAGERSSRYFGGKFSRGGSLSSPAMEEFFCLVRLIYHLRNSVANYLFI